MTWSSATAAPSFSASATAYRAPDRDSSEKSVVVRIFTMFGGVAVVAIWRRVFPGLFESFMFIAIVSRDCFPERRHAASHAEASNEARHQTDPKRGMKSGQCCSAMSQDLLRPEHGLRLGLIAGHL